MSHFQSFTTYAQRSKAIEEEAIVKQKLDEQQKYADFFKNLLQKYDITSPSQLDDEKKKEFFSEIESGWKAEDEQSKES